MHHFLFLDLKGDGIGDHIFSEQINNSIPCSFCKSILLTTFYSATGRILIPRLQTAMRSNSHPKNPALCCKTRNRGKGKVHKKVYERARGQPTWAHSENSTVLFPSLLNSSRSTPEHGCLYNVHPRDRRGRGKGEKRATTNR